VLETVLRNHATQGNDLSLAILIHVVRQQFSIFEEQHWLSSDFPKVLEAASKFDVLDTSPELQHEFCALWNQVRADDVIYPGWMFSDRFAIFISRSIYTPILPQLHSPLPQMTRTTFCLSHPHIPYASSLAITQTRCLTSMTPLPPPPFPMLSCMKMLHWSFFPFQHSRRAIPFLTRSRSR
jgi:hypothetical protein